MLKLTLYAALATVAVNAYAAHLTGGMVSDLVMRLVEVLT